MIRRFEKFCALWLVAQIFLPCTAPFPTCDLSDLLGNASHHRAPIVPPNARVDGDYAFAPPLATAAGRLRLLVVSSLDGSSGVGVVPVIDLGRPVAPPDGKPRRPQIQPAVLRL
jgi:hypothetical protein